MNSLVQCTKHILCPCMQLRYGYNFKLYLQTQRPLQSEMILLSFPDSSDQLQHLMEAHGKISGLNYLLLSIIQEHEMSHNTSCRKYLLQKLWQDYIVRNHDRYLQNLPANLLYPFNLIHLEFSFSCVQNYIYAPEHMV